jgi:hypothetical protein
MPFAITWYLPHRILHLQLVGSISLNDVEQIQHMFSTYLDMGEPQVHALMDLTQLEDYPKNIPQLKTALTMIDNPSLGWIIIINHDPVLKFLASVLVQMSVRDVRLRMFDTLEDGLTFLQERDTTLQLQAKQNPVISEEYCPAREYPALRPVPDGAASDRSIPLKMPAQCPPAARPLTALPGAAGS